MRSREILQDYLDRVGEAVMSGNLDVYVEAVHLPFQLRTERAKIVIESMEELVEGFDTFVDMLHDMKVTHYVRVAESAVAMNNDVIAGRYVSHMFSHGKSVVPAFRSQIILRNQDDVWRAEAIDNRFFNGRWPIYLPDIRGSA